MKNKKSILLVKPPLPIEPASSAFPTLYGPPQVSSPQVSLLHLVPKILSVIGIPVIALIGIIVYLKKGKASKKKKIVVSAIIGIFALLIALAIGFINYKKV